MTPEIVSAQLAELREAWKLAALAHRGQPYVMDDTSMPYLGHVGDVAAIAKVVYPPGYAGVYEL